MCNIAGYIGPHEAAPILIAMMQAESGYGGGYYSGMAVVSRGGLLSAKILGDMDRLLEQTGVRSFPGKLGIIHSRSNSGGDDAWAHPFISNDGKMAYVANGAAGAYADLRKSDAITQMLEDKGVCFSSEADRRIEGYPVLHSGHGVHVSETVCHLIRQFQLEEGLPLDQAMEKAFLQFPAEIVGLSVSEEEPDRIAFGRFNQPMIVARTEDEVFLATTALAFPTDRNYLSITSLPECSSGYVSLKETKIHRFRPVLPVQPFTPQIWMKVSQCVIDCLKASDQPLSVPRLIRETMEKQCWPEGALPQANTAVYEVLYELRSQGKLEIESFEEEGAPEGKALGIKTHAFRVRYREEA